MSDRCAMTIRFQFLFQFLQAAGICNNTGINYNELDEVQAKQLQFILHFILLFCPKMQRILLQYLERKIVAMIWEAFALQNQSADSFGKHFTAIRRDKCTVAKRIARF